MSRQTIRWQESRGESILQRHKFVSQFRDSCVIMPHIGSATSATRTSMANMAVANVLAVLSNEPMVSEKRV